MSFILHHLAVALTTLALVARASAQTDLPKAESPPEKKDAPELRREKKDTEAATTPIADENTKGAPKTEEKGKVPDTDPAAGWYSVYGQGTVVPQGNWKFRSPYAGLNSLPSILNYRTTETATLYLAARLWEGGEVIFDPEISGGSGIGRTLGLAGFANGEATRVGAVQPTIYVARLLYSQTFGLGGEREPIKAGPNLIAGEQDVSRLTFRVGKMSAVDQFDDNAYSHDPRTQFLNWSIMYNGAWDYPANTRGYTYGGTAEFNQKDWAVRYGVWGEPSVSNGAPIDPHILKAQGQALEFEYRYKLATRPGTVLLLAFLNHAHMGKYSQALDQMPVNPDITLTRSYREKYGLGLNFEQEISDDLGGFLRLGWNDGRSESWAFTEIDSTVSSGLLLKGTRWSRPTDKVGLAFAFNGISKSHRDYLAAGGYGFIVGDGRLNYGAEQIIETFYNWEIKTGINVTFDFQGVNLPAYNRDRGPVAIAATRVHFEY